MAFFPSVGAPPNLANVVDLRHRHVATTASLSSAAQPRRIDLTGVKNFAINNPKFNEALASFVPSLPQPPSSATLLFREMEGASRKNQTPDVPAVKSSAKKSLSPENVVRFLSNNKAIRKALMRYAGKDDVLQIMKAAATELVTKENTISPETQKKLATSSVPQKLGEVFKYLKDHLFDSTEDEAKGDISATEWKELRMTFMFSKTSHYMCEGGHVTRHSEFVLILKPPSSDDVENEFGKQIPDKPVRSCPAVVDPTCRKDAVLVYEESILRLPLYPMIRGSISADSYRILKKHKYHPRAVLLQRNILYERGDMDCDEALSGKKGKLLFTMFELDSSALEAGLGALPLSPEVKKRLAEMAEQGTAPCRFPNPANTCAVASSLNSLVCVPEYLRRMMKSKLEKSYGRGEKSLLMRMLQYADGLSDRIVKNDYDPIPLPVDIVHELTVARVLVLPTGNSSMFDGSYPGCFFEAIENSVKDLKDMVDITFATTNTFEHDGLLRVGPFYNKPVHIWIAPADEAKKPAVGDVFHLHRNGTIMNIVAAFADHCVLIHVDPDGRIVLVNDDVVFCYDQLLPHHRKLMVDAFVLCPYHREGEEYAKKNF